MRTWGRATVIALFLISCGVAPAGGQNSKHQARPFFEVKLQVTVVEKQQMVTGLRKDSFRIYENGVRQSLRSLTTDRSNPPVYAGLIMDTSNSITNKLSLYKEAASNFLYTVVSLRKNKAAFMTSDSEIALRQDFTDKLDLLQTAVDKVKKTGSKSALFDAVWIFADEKFRNIPGRRVMVIISDGDDTFSRTDLNDAIDIAQRTHTTIFIVSTKAGFLANGQPVDFNRDLALDALSEQTGGRVFYATDMLSLERALKLIADELKYQYVLTYRPKDQKADGRTRTIEVRLRKKADAAKFQVRTLRSYRVIPSLN